MNSSFTGVAYVIAAGLGGGGGGVGGAGGAVAGTWAPVPCGGVFIPSFGPGGYPGPTGPSSPRPWEIHPPNMLTHEELLDALVCSSYDPVRRKSFKEEVLRRLSGVPLPNAAVARKVHEE